MHGLTLFLLGLFGAGALNDYTRSLNAKNLDQAALDAEGYGETKSFKREADGLRITLGPGEKETGWKTPQQLRFGGDFTISANFVIRTLPKPAQEDGAAVGLAIAFQNIEQPDVTLVRLREPNGSEVYRSIDRGANNPQQQQQQQQQMMMFNPFQQPGAKPPKPPRPTFPASGATIRLELQREGSIIRFQVLDAITSQPRYLGQLSPGTNDVAAVKLFAANRNGAEAINVLLRDITIRAERITGLGTAVRTVFDTVVYAEPTAIDKDILIVGGEPKTPPPAKPKAPEGKGDAKPAGAKTESGKPKSTEKTATKAETPQPKSDPAKKAVDAPSEKPKTAKDETAQTKTKDAPAQKKTADASPKTPEKPPKPKEPKAKIPLDEVESIRFERTAALSGRFRGQPNFDFTMPGLSARKEDTPAKKNAEKQNDAKKDDSKKAEAKKDDPKKAETKKAEAKKDDPKKAETKKAEAKKDDPKKAEAKKAEAKKDDPKKPDAGDDVLAPPPGTTVAAKVPKLEPKKNGIRDLNLFLANLRNVAIKQVTVNCQTGSGQTSWRLDTTDSQDWPLVVRRSGTEAWADLYLEPPPGDCFEKNFTVAVVYADGQNGNTNIKAEEHTDPKRAVDSKGPEVPPLDAWIYLAGDEKLFGRLESLSEESARLITPWQDSLDVPLSRVIGIHLCLLDRKESSESFARRMKTRGSEDVLLAQTNGEVLAIPGVVERSDHDKLHFLYQGRSRTLPLKRVEGLIMAARPDSVRQDALRPTFALPGGLAISGRWKDLDTSTWKVETAWGQELKLPAAEIQAVHFHGGKRTNLADLNPSKVEEAPFFGRRLPWRRNVGLTGAPLKINGHTYEHGVAVHSRCALTYDLNGQYATFETLVGFEDAAGGKGRVVCRVFADDKELYANPDLRADAPPVKLSLAVAGAEQLRLVVDFGRGQDTGDRVIWANARLLRQAPKKVSNATPGKTAERR